ncbi:hypothetical protein HC251_20285 [Iamia sp. SCSIO 61187]|uniref:Kelch repeat-containing protein n=1 Tax=Iamia sp. SCSIO 61187 TaxID=2722752 RepID=UPI001C62C363|nr:hypothetical protein [Iamia sp. SCSIO 61187]QYG94536.1 hypothetical protein HC251_20285 [Iamia sp. SCSIO 61187]
MIDFEPALRQHLDRAASDVEAPPGLLSTIERRVVAQRRRTVALRLAGALVVVALAAGITLTVTNGADDQDGATVATDPSGTTSPAPPDASTTVVPPQPPGPVPTSGAWSPMADAPIAGRIDHMAVDMDGEVLVWGGDGFDGEPRLDGAVYETATDSWRSIPASPLPGGGSALGVWTGSVALVLDWNGGTLALAAFDPATDRWTRMADPPSSVSRDGIPSIAWAGDRLVLVSALGSRAQVATYEPATATWTEQADPPMVVGGFASDVVWTGSEVLFVGEASGADATSATTVVLAYDPAADEWRTIPLGLTDDQRYATAAVWTGTHLLVGGGATPSGTGLADAALLDPDTGVWTPLPDAPAPFSGNPFGTEVWTGTRFVAVFERPDGLGGTPVAFDITTGGWSQGPESDSPVGRVPTVWSGDRVVVPLGGETSPTPDGVGFCCDRGPAGGTSYTP